jgi:FkbM family methyltransferase
MTGNPLFSHGAATLTKACTLRRADVFIDAGANFGGMIDNAEGMEVHAFEPIPEMFAKLTANRWNRPRTRLNQLGLSDANTTLKDVAVLGCWTLATAGTTKMDEAVEFKGQRLTVQLVTLDSYCQAHSLKIGVLKLDVDGYEFHVLRGAKETIMRDRPFIFAEFSYLMHPLGESVSAFIDYILDTLNYVVMSIDGHFVTCDRALILKHYPFHTSFDVALVPAEQIADYSL